MKDISKQKEIAQNKIVTNSGVLAITGGGAALCITQLFSAATLSGGSELFLITGAAANLGVAALGGVAIYGAVKTLRSLNTDIGKQKPPATPKLLPG